MRDTEYRIDSFFWMGEIGYNRSLNLLLCSPQNRLESVYLPESYVGGLLAFIKKRSVSEIVGSQLQLPNENPNPILLIYLHELLFKSGTKEKVTDENFIETVSDAFGHMALPDFQDTLMHDLVLFFRNKAPSGVHTMIVNIIQLVSIKSKNTVSLRYATSEEIEKLLEENVSKKIRYDSANHFLFVLQNNDEQYYVLMNMHYWTEPVFSWF